MKVLIFAICVAVAHAWIPGPKPVCNQDNVDSGTMLMAHERYCQLYYSCDGDLNDFAGGCPDGFLFAYTIGLANCVKPENDLATCVNWGCDQINIGARYPDTCCNKYWECTATGYAQRFCANGQVFDSNAEVCTFNTGQTCIESGFCYDLIQPSSETRCHDFPSDDGNPCTYKTVYAGVTTANRPCPDGASFDSITCQCSNFNSACNNQLLTYEQAVANKAFDANCRISRRLDFTFVPLRTFSEKINLELRHYFLTNGVSTSNNEAVFTAATAGQGTLIYDYFFNDNELFAPFALTMLVRFDALPAIGTSYVLVSNDFSLDPNNPLCSPSTFEIRARYDGISGGLRVWNFAISAQGSNTVVANAQGSITGDVNDYYEIIFTFTGGISASIFNRGINGINALINPTTISAPENLGTKLRPNKCGFVIGRGLTGRIREFNVYEGCGNFQLLGI